MSSKEIQYGYCHCGCGRKTKIAERNYWSTGTISGEPYKYIRGHTHLRTAGPEVAEGYKWCGRCKEVKPIDEFFKHPTEPDGFQSHCKLCMQKYHSVYLKTHREKEKLYNVRTNLKRKFNLTYEQYKEILDSQDGKCSICHEEDDMISPVTNLRRILAVDH